MILRLTLFALMAVGLLGFGTVAWISAHPPGTSQSNQAAAIATRHVIILARDVRAGTLLKAEDLTEKELGAAEAAQQPLAMTVSAEARRNLLGAMVRRPLIAGDILRPADVLRPGEHGFLAAVLRAGMRAVTVGVDSVSGSAGLIWPGDRVDLILTESIEDATLPAGRRVAAETVLQDVRVIAIDQQLAQGGDPSADNGKAARTVTLEVTEDQAERVQVAARIGHLSLTVRSAEQSRQVVDGPLPPVWAGDVSHALTTVPAPPPGNVLRVYRGAADGKEFHF
ncbi:MAG TPA: Flp pilus assembly protein CpaB [Acetobacteraceae bacterium]|nr:Flp pilus assembly protein CpaB [Acetobacteraceae bacterium]